MYTEHTRECQSVHALSAPELKDMEGEGEGGGKREIHVKVGYNTKRERGALSDPQW